MSATLGWFRCAALVALAWCSVAAAQTPEFGAAQASGATPGGERVWRSASLGLVSGAKLRGELSPGADGAMALRAAAFEGELPLRLEAFDWVEFHRPAAPAEAADDAATPAPLPFGFELADGTRFVGEVLAIDTSAWRVRTDLLGDVLLPCEAIVRVEHAGHDGVLYRGPTSAVGWEVSGRKDGWTFADGKLVASGSRSVLSRAFGSLEDRPITLRLGWRGEPMFRVGLGVLRDVGDDVVLEAWGDRLVAWRDTGRRLELFEFPVGLPALEELTVRARISGGRVTFFDASGGELGSLSRGERVGGEVEFVCDGLGLVLHELTIGARAAPAVASDLVLADVTGFDVPRRTFLTKAGAVGERQVATVTRGGAPAAHYEAPMAALGGPSVLRFVHTSGSEVTGTFSGVEAPAGWRVQVPWSHEPLVCPMDGLARIEVRQHAADRRRYKAALESFAGTGRGELAGTFVGLDEEGRLKFLPTIAATPVQLEHKGLERLVFNTKSAFFAPANRFPHLVHLRSGETLRAKVTRVTPEAVTLEAALGPASDVPTALVKAVEVDLRAAAELRGRLAPPPREEGGSQAAVELIEWGGAALPVRRHEAPFRKESLELALALPRKYKDRPPSHLLVGSNGDFTRANLAGFGPAGAHVATRAVTESGESVVELIPADRVVALVWLAPDPSPAAEPPPPSVAGVTGRLHVDPENVLDVVLLAADREQLRFHSPVLGEFSLPHASVQRLELDGERQPCFYARWVLTPMPEPRMAE